ncbi:prepilin-type N-terminal cleavage/methylation domain-containing protein [Paenibacillus silvisoli]|uniref:prepilin-type N-terminal cleavage/methylation domain-containing protein n=1 Tax=Paenibacillus silvisoli TaxID=3110539 RepID=UPI0028062FCF|nr:prepilin-type N-terminal cleavage/methylation domain-containing protein [Paenibacillus silvisoli]
MNAVDKEQGFTLMEVLVAVVILAVLVMAFIGYFLRGSDTIAQTGTRGQKLYTAQQNLEGRTNLGTLQAGEIVYAASGSLPKISITGNLATSVIQGSRVLTEFIPD